MTSDDPFLRSSDVVDWQHPDVLARARALAEGGGDVVALTRRAFEFVRDGIRHSADFGLRAVTCAASDVLREGSGYCYAKSHLLAALLRANGVPTGFCYQRLSLDDAGPPFALHGFNAVLLPEHGWYRIDPRGNRRGIDAGCSPPIERLAFTPTLPGEMDLPDIYPDPLPVVVEALRRHAVAGDLARDLPDLAPASAGHRVGGQERARR